MPKDTNYYLVKTRALEKSKAEADQVAQESKSKVTAIDSAYDAADKAKKIRKKAEKDSMDIKFMLDQKKGVTSSVLNKAADVFGKTTDNKETQERLKAELETANKLATEAATADFAAKKNLANLRPGNSDSDKKWRENQARSKAADDEQISAEINRKLTKKEFKITQLEFAEKDAKLNGSINALEQKFKDVIPNGDAQLAALDTAEKEVGQKAQVADQKEATLANFQAQANGSSEAQAQNALDSALKKLEDAEKFITEWKGDKQTLAQLEKKRDALKEVAQTTKDEHRLFVDTAAGSTATLDKMEKEGKGLLVDLKTALTNAADGDKAALKKKIAACEAELARLAEFRKQAAAIQAAGIPAATDDLAKAKEAQSGARDNLVEAQSEVLSLERGLLTFDKKTRKFAADSQKSIEDRKGEIAQKDEAINELLEAIKNGTDEEKAAAKEKLKAAEAERDKLDKGLVFQENALKEFIEQSRQAAENSLPDKDKKALAVARKKEESAKTALEDAKKLVEDKKQGVEAAVKTATKGAQADFDKAQQEFATATQDYEKQTTEYEQAVAGHPDLKKANEEVAAATKAAAEAGVNQEKALASYTTAEEKALVAETLKQAVKDSEQDAAAFAPFKHLTDEDFEKAVRGKGGSEATALNLFPEKPKFPGDTASDSDKKAFAAAQKDYETKSAVVIENLRKAQETMDRMAERDELLEQAGASLEERKRAFGDVPPALMPPKFREELQAYREVEELFKVEDEYERLKKAAKEEVTNNILKDLKGLAEVAKPIVELFLDASGIINNFIPTPKELPEDADEAQKSAFEAAEALKAKFEMTRMVAEGIECFMNTKEMLESEKETIDEVSNPKDEEKAILRSMKEDKKAEALLKFMKDFIITTAKTTKGVLSMTKAGIGLAHNTGAAEVAKTIGGVVPILGAVLDGIETAEAMLAAAKQIKMAHLENEIHAASKESGDEEALVNAYGNQAGRATNRAVKKSLHATSKAVQTAGSATMAGGVSAGAGAGIYAAGKVGEYANKVTFQCIDWAQAAKAQKTMELARAGSFQAMNEIFADHQKYATMFIVMKAVEGDVKAQAFCKTRGLNTNNLDSATSLALLTKELKVARQEMLRKVEQTDDAKTFQDDASETFEKVVRGGKALAKLGDMATLGTAGMAVDAVKDGVNKLRGKMADVEAKPEADVDETNKIKPINAAGFTSLHTRITTISEKGTKGFSITEKDVQWRARWIEHMKNLLGNLDPMDGDWPDPSMKKDGGETARQKLTKAFFALKALPDTPTQQAA